MKLLEIVLKEDFRTQYKKFTEKDGIDGEIVKSYLTYFKKIKDKHPKQLETNKISISVPIEKRKDIDAYSNFGELEKIVDYLRGQVDIEIDNEVTVTGDHTVFENSNIKISKGVDPKSCVTIRGSETPSWCVARSDMASNLYYSYRLKEYEPTFYFVRNKKQTKKNGKYYFFVVQVLNNDEYIVTSAENDGDKKLTWKEIVSICPALKAHKKIFKHDPVKSEERASSGFRNLTDSGYSKLSYRHKKLYIDGNHKLNDEKFRDTPIDLITYYVNLGRFLTTKQEEYISENEPKLYKRYQDLLKRKIGDNKFLKMLNSLDSGELNRNEVDLNEFKGGDLITDVSTRRYWNGIIILDIESEDSFYREADISSDGIDFLKSVSSSQHYYEFDRSETDYMWNYFTSDTEKVIIQLLNLVGVPTYKTKDLEQEGVLSKLIDSFSFGNKIKECFIDEAGSMRARAESEEAESMLAPLYELPFEFEYRGIEIPDIGSFVTKIIEVNPEIGNFQQAIVELLESTGLGNQDLYDLQYYNNEDTTELNREMVRTVERIIDDLDEDYGESYKKIVSLLDKLGFKDDKVENELVSIEILDYVPKDLVNDNPTADPEIEVTILDKKTKKRERGVIKLSSLPNYLNNYQLFETVKKIKKVMFS